MRLTGCIMLSQAEDVEEAALGAEKTTSSNARRVERETNIWQVENLLSSAQLEQECWGRRWTEEAESEVGPVMCGSDKEQRRVRNLC